MSVSPWWYIAIVRRLPCELKISCTSTTAESRAKIWPKQNAFKPPVAYAAARSKAVVLLLLTCFLLLPLWESVIVLCFSVRYFMSILVLQSSWLGRESWLLCLVCLPGAPWLLGGSSSWWHGFVCSLLLSYFLNILTIFAPQTLHNSFVFTCPWFRSGTNYFFNLDFGLFRKTNRTTISDPICIGYRSYITGIKQELA